MQSIRNLRKRLVRISWTIPAILLGGLVVGVIFALTIIWEEIEPTPKGIVSQRWIPEIGTAVEDFELSDVNGENVRLSDYYGVPVVINFWGTWCPPCREEMPLLQKYYQEYSTEFIILGVNVQDSSEQVWNFMNESPIDFPVLLDEEAFVAEQFIVRAFPTTFILDKSGILRVHHIGLLSEVIFREYLQEVEVGL